MSENIFLGQEEQNQNLFRSIASGTFAHAHFFLGKEGHGSLTTALACIKFQFCLNRTELSLEACNNCSSCTKIEHFTHPDVHIVYPANNESSKNKVDRSVYFEKWITLYNDRKGYFGLEDWLSKIEIGNKQLVLPKEKVLEVIQKIQLNSFESKSKAILFWRPELMNQVSANTLLKTLEEPPSNTYIFLVSDTTKYILPTILSRVQITKVLKFSQNVFSEFMNSSFNISKSDAEELYKRSQADIAKSYNIYFGNAGNNENFDAFKQLMRIAYKADVLGIVKWSEQMSANNREFQKAFVRYFTFFIRQSILSNFCVTPDRLKITSKKEDEFILNFSKYVHSKNASSLLKLIQESGKALNFNVNSMLVFINLALKLTKLIRIKNTL